MPRKIFLLSIALSLCLLVLLIGLPPIWNSQIIAASQDKTNDAEVSAAIAEQKQEASNLTRNQLAEQKFQELSAKAQSGGTVSLIVKLRVAFRPEGEMPGAAGVQAQRAVIAQTQDSLMKELTEYDPASLKRFEYTPYVALRVNSAGLEELRQSSDVIDIHEDSLLQPSLSQSVSISGAPVQWGKGYTGAGKAIAILDTGVDKTHPFLSGKVVSEACYSSNNTGEHATSLCPGGVTESTAVGSGRNCSLDDDCDHGTHVAGIAAGNGSGLSGVAKDANIISIQVFSRINDESECDGASPCIRSLTSDLLKALERVYSLRNSFSIASVNLSLGNGRFFSNCDTNPLKGIIDQLRSAGIATVIASGNNSYSDAINEPACISSAISVGATGDGTFYGANQVATGYSNSAPFLTMLAPGDSITSSVPGGGFGTASGTSMAAPHVAGAWAILKQRTPEAGVTELLSYLTSRGFPVTDFRNNVTRPRLNLGSPPGCVATNISTNRWKGEYYDNTDLNGSPLVVRDDGDAFLNFNFGDGGPNSACDMGVDNFSVRWTRMVFFNKTGLYRFTVTADDGVRLYVDGRLKLDKWVTQGPTTYIADVFIPSASHEIRLEYFEGAGGAMAQLSWEDLNSNCYADVPGSQWKGEYYNTTDLTGEPAMVSADGDGFLNFNWGDGSPNSNCFLNSDSFSARWTRTSFWSTGTYRFIVTADDGVRLWIDGQLKIDKWFIQGPTTYTVDVFLRGDLHEIKLEYFEGGGGAVAQFSWEVIEGNCTVQSVPSDHWRGEYHSEAGFPGTPLMTRDDGDGFINFDWGAGAPRPGCGIGADNFQVVWTRYVNFEPGIYRFTTTTDDGVRLYVNGRLVIDKWVIQGPTTYTADMIMQGGNAEVRMWYFEATGGAMAQLSWEKLPSDCYANVAPGRWKGTYYGNINLTGDPVMIRDEGEGFLNFDWGAGSPSASCMGADFFSARWVRNVNFTPGTYRFTFTGDDGVRLWINGSLAINKWFTQGPTTYTADVFLGSGEIRLEYFEQAGGAMAQLSWAMLPADCQASVNFDRWRGVYYNSIGLSGAPAMVRDDGDGFLNFDWGVGSPSEHCGLGVDNFSARWTRTVNLAPGPYRFTVTGDDGVRLYVDGALVINKWITQGPTTYTADVHKFGNGGPTNIQLEYFDSGGGAVAKVSWEAFPLECAVFNIPSDQWKGEYFNNTNFSGSPAMTRNDGAGFLDFNFGDGSPSQTCGLGADNFSARWTRWINFEPGRYRFTVTADDGVRLFIGGGTVIDKWFIQGPTTYTAERTISSSGPTFVRLEYFEGNGGALIRLNWERIDP